MSNNVVMKKLEDLPKKVDYKVPDGYFDSLPGRIQAKVTAGKKPAWQFSLGLTMRYAVPLAALVGIGIFWYNQNNNSIVDELAEIDENQLSWFLEETELTTDELASSVSWTTEDLDALEEEVYNAVDLSGKGLDVVIDEFELENL
jgi:hypothetical protein